MAITDIPILSMLRTKMNWSQERQKVLAENVANSDTPNYRERDLVLLKFDEAGEIRGRPMRAWRSPRPKAGTRRQTLSTRRFEQTRQGNYDVSPTGNSVNLEDEMMKVAANQMDYQAATALYSRSLNLLKVALGKR